jgi:hypothetical protein
MCETPLFSTKIMAISGIQPMVLFHLVATLCENGGTPDVVVRSEDAFRPPIISHPIFEANRTMEVFKVQPKS